MCLNVLPCTSLYFIVLQAEVLTVRWSNDDPNPVAIVKQKREFRDRFTEVSEIRAKE
jgi:hypothetical protein